MVLSTAIFAFVIAAVGLAGLVLLTSRVAALTLDLASLHRKIERINTTIGTMQSDIAIRTPTSLRAELDDLRGALDVIRASTRKEFGSLWGRLGGKHNGKIIDGVTGQPLEGDEELQAMLALQTAKPNGA